jgi:cobalt-zinc-cadmium efflux system outer membrane protein
MNLIRFMTRAARRRVLDAVLRIALASSVAFATHAADGPLTLDAAIDRALRDAPQVAASQASLEGSQASLMSAGRLPDPELVVGVDNLPINGADQFSLTRDFMTMRKVGLMQSVPAGAKRRYRAELASREADVAQAELRATRFETAGAAAEAWISSAAAEETLKRFRGLKSDLSSQSSAARAALSSGRSTAADALSSEAALARLDSQILELEQQRAMYRAELTRWVGDAATLDLGDLPWRRELPVAPDLLVQEVASHPPLAPIAAKVEAAKTEVDLARAEKRSDWSAELSFAKRGPDYSDMVSLEFRVGLPLFAKNRQNPAIAAKLASVRVSEAEQEAALRLHRAEIESMVAVWRAGRKRLEHFESTLLPLGRDRSRAVLSAYGTGRGDLRAALDALRDEVDLQREYVALEGDVTRAWVFLHLLHAKGATP